jgi:ASC-1-like (ASCH) protein
MEHLAILRKSWNLSQKILDGRKTIESRWYVTKRAPFDRIDAGETIYFKESGEPVRIKAQVSDVKQFVDLDVEKIRKIFEEYSGICPIDSEDSIERNKDKRYCVLVFLMNPKAIKPFEINKKGYGIMSAWICINKIDDIKKKQGFVV